MRDPWLLRPYEPSDEDGVVSHWLLSFRKSRYGYQYRSLLAGCDIGSWEQEQLNIRREHRKSRPPEFAEADNKFWKAHVPIVESLLAHERTLVLCDVEDPGVMLGFACVGDGIVHYAMVKRRFDENGDSAEIMQRLLGDRLALAQQRYSHELVEFKRDVFRSRGICVPRTWIYDPFECARRAAA